MRLVKRWSVVWECDVALRLERHRRAVAHQIAFELEAQRHPAAVRLPALQRLLRRCGQVSFRRTLDRQIQVSCAPDVRLSLSAMVDQNNLAALNVDRSNVEAEFSTALLKERQIQ